MPATTPPVVTPLAAVSASTAIQLLEQLRTEDLACLCALDPKRLVDRASLLAFIRRRPQFCYAWIEQHIEEIRVRAADRAQQELAYLGSLARFG